MLHLVCLKRGPYEASEGTHPGHGEAEIGEGRKRQENYPVRQTKNFSGKLFVLPFESTQMCRVSPSAMISS
jgi:hypothetical protein